MSKTPQRQPIQKEDVERLFVLRQDADAKALRWQETSAGSYDAEVAIKAYMDALHEESDRLLDFALFWLGIDPAVPSQEERSQS